MSSNPRLLAARARLAEAAAVSPVGRAVLPFGDPRIDAHLAGGGLPLGCWHELAGEGLERETAAAPAAFTAALIAPLAARGAIAWILRREDLYPPGLFGLGFPASRLILIKTRDETETLNALADTLGAAGIAAAVAEAEGPDLTAGRRLQLACERHGATGFLLRRRPFGGPERGPANAATTRWRIAAAPSVPAPGEPGLGVPRWRAELERARGGRPGAWLFELEGRLRVVERLGVETEREGWRLAG